MIESSILTIIPRPTIGHLRLQFQLPVKFLLFGHRDPNHFEMIQGNSVGRLATKEIPTNASLVGSARPLSMVFDSTRVDR